jgi:hypothetical protein
MTNVSTVLSVRGEARREVSPDAATFYCAVEVRIEGKAPALAALAARVHAVLDRLRELGGVPRTATAEPPALAWEAGSPTAHPIVRRQGPTGRVLADQRVRVTVRDFALLDQVGAILLDAPDVQLHGVRWSVDDSNPAWPEVRAAAIEAAIQKGRDYATALGGTLSRIDEIADIGLLGDSSAARAAPRSTGYVMESESAEAGDPTTLVPPAQELRAAIDARFVASVRSLA